MSDLTSTPIAALIAKSVPGEWGVEATGDSSDIFVLRSTNFTASGRLDYSDVVVRSLPPSKRASCRLEAGDILLEKSGGGPDQLVGRVNYFEGSNCGDFAYSNFIQRLSIAKPNHPKYVFFRLWQAYREGITARYEQQTTGIRNLKLKDLLREKLGVHAPEVQERVATILTTVDNQIEKTEALIAKYQSIKQGLMHDLFTRGVDEHGRLRPSRDEAPKLYKESEIGWIPKDWDAPCIRDIAPHVGSGVTPTGGSEVYVNEGVLFIRSQNVDFDGLLLDDVAFISPRIHEQMQRSEIFPHDVLLNITGASIGRVCPFPEGLGIANVNQHVCAIRTHAPCEADAWYLASVLASPIGQNQIYRLNAGGNREGLNYAQIRSFRIPWPKPKEREVIARRLQSIGSRQMAEQGWLLKLQVLKLGLMQDLLTGKVPVKPEHSDLDNGVTSNGAAKAGVKSRGEGIHA